MAVRLACLLGVAGVLLLVQTWLHDPGRQPGAFPRKATDPDASCGPVSVAIAARWLDRNVTLRVINEYTHTGSSGITSLFELQGAMREMGLEAEAVRLDPRKGIPWSLPTILHVSGNHFVPVLPAPKGKLVVAEPPEAPRALDGPGALGGWEGMALVTARTREELDNALASAGLLKAPAEATNPPERGVSTAGTSGFAVEGAASSTR